MTAPDALEFLAREVEQQAQMESVALSPVERKMMRWSEVEPGAFCDASISKEFDQNYDSDEYEHKISELLERAYERVKQTSNAQLWEDAKNALIGHDYYLLVMAEGVFGTLFSPARRRSARYALVVCAIVAVMLLGLWLTHR